MQAGHPGLPLGCAPIGYVLFDEVMKYNPKNPQWFNRDRFVLSAGHGVLLQYILLHLVGYDSVQVSGKNQAPRTRVLGSDVVSKRKNASESIARDARVHEWRNSVQYVCIAVGTNIVLSTRCCPVFGYDSVQVSGKTRRVWLDSGFFEREKKGILGVYILLTMKVTH
jgi:hypothetical protein